MIKLRGVSKRFPGRDGQAHVAVADLSLSIASGETLGLVGTSGSGKTTTLRLINRLVEPDRGSILVGGEETRGLDPIALRRRMGYVIQTGGLFPHLTVARNISMLCEIEKWSGQRIDQRVDDLLRLVNLEPGVYAARYPSELSGGQRQRVGVARALALNPPIVLMDEPFGALDRITRDQLQGEFAELFGRMQKTIVLVTHDLEEAFRLGERVALMDAGALVQVGTRHELVNSPATEFVAEFVGARPESARSGGTDA